MHRIDTATKAPDLFGAGKDGFKDGDKALGIPATELTAAFFNDIQENLARLVEAGGDALAKGDYSQLLNTLIKKGFQGSHFSVSPAAGTADAITAIYTPAITALTDGMLLHVRAGAANATTTPTFTPAAGTIAAKVIVKGANIALAVGDVSGRSVLQYDATFDKWVLLNPATWASAPTVPVGTVIYVAQNAQPTGYLKANGAAVSRATYAALFAVVGTTFGAGDGATTFNLPDLRGEFLRGWDDGRGVDSGRVFGSAQLDQMQQITGTFESQGLATASNTGAFAGSVMQANAWTAAGGSSTRANQSYDFNSANSPGARAGAETRPRNVAMLACIKY